MALTDDRPDIGLATVVDVLSAAAADGAVARPVVIEREKVRSCAPAPSLRRTGLFAADAFAGVLDDLAARRDALGGIDPPTVNLRGLDLEPEIRVVLINGWSGIGLSRLGILRNL